MSYDINVVSKSGEELYSETPHVLRGGTFAMGGTKELWLSVTYNYSALFRKLFGEEGIRKFNGKLVKDTIGELREASASLQDDDEPDYWKPTEGNVKKTLNNLVELANLSPDPEAVWSIT